jgi:hypothetical protein
MAKAFSKSKAEARLHNTLDFRLRRPAGNRAMLPESQNPGDES